MLFAAPFFFNRVPVVTEHTMVAGTTDFSNVGFVSTGGYYNTLVPATPTGTFTPSGTGGGGTVSDLLNAGLVVTDNTIRLSKIVIDGTPFDLTISSTSSGYVVYQHGRTFTDGQTYHIELVGM